MGSFQIFAGVGSPEVHPRLWKGVHWAHNSYTYFFPNLIPLSLPLKYTNILVMCLPNFGSSSHWLLTSPRFYPSDLSPDHLCDQDIQTQCPSLGRTCLVPFDCFPSIFPICRHLELFLFSVLHLSLFTLLVLFLSPSVSSHPSFTLHIEPIPVWHHHVTLFPFKSPFP